MSFVKTVKSSLRATFITNKWKKRLENDGFSIFSNDCTGGRLLHDLSLPFLSPTINMFFSAKDYLRFLENPENYLGYEMKQIDMPQYNYPVAMLKDIQCHLVHYKSVEEANEKWIQRSARVNLDKLYVIMNDRNGCEYEDMVRFDRLTYKHKVLLSHEAHPELRSVYWVKEFQNKQEVGIMTSYKRKMSIRRNLDCFDWVFWLNAK